MFLLNYDERNALHATDFITNGIGDQLAFHIYDATPTFDVSVPQVMAEITRNFSGSRSPGSDGLGVAFLLSSLNTPVYISAPVQNAKIVDAFLDKLDDVLVAQSHKEEDGWFRASEDAYTSELPGNPGYKLHAHTIGFSGVKWRLCWARIGNGLYVASKPFVLADIAALNGHAPADAGPVGHGMVRVRAKNWKEPLPDFRLGWEENNRRACLNNLAPLSSVVRAVKAAEIPGDRAAYIENFSREFCGAHLFCPDGGKYEVAPDGKSVVCSKHGTMASPRQALAPDETAPAGKAISSFAGMTAALTFMEDGLHAVVTIDRK
jgi:hypothetical protein